MEEEEEAGEADAEDEVDDEEEEEEEGDDDDDGGPSTPAPSSEPAPGEAATMTEPENLGPLEPGTAVKLQGIVENEDDLGETDSKK